MTTVLQTLISPSGLYAGLRVAAIPLYTNKLPLLYRAFSPYNHHIQN